MKMHRNLAAGFALAFALCVTPVIGQLSGTLSQSVDNITVSPGIGVACAGTNAGGMQFTRANSFWRSYNLLAEGLAGNIDVTAVTFGVENALAANGATGGSVTITVNLYVDPNPDPTMTTITVAGLQLAHTEMVTVPDGMTQIITAPLSVPVTFQITDTVVVEVSAPDLITPVGVYFPGGNNFGETAPSYLSSAACAITNPVTYASIGFPNSHLIINMDWNLSGASFTYPGSNEDLNLRSSIGVGVTPTGGIGDDIKTITMGSVLNLLMESPLGTFDLMPPVLVGEVFTTGNPPTGPGGSFSSVHFNPSSPTLFALVIGTNLTPIGFTEILLPGGNLHAYVTPPGLSGLSIIFQALVPTPAANNGFFSITNGHEIQFL